MYEFYRCFIDVLTNSNLRIKVSDSAGSLFQADIGQISAASYKIQLPVGIEYLLKC